MTDPDPSSVAGRIANPRRSRQIGTAALALGLSLLCASDATFQALSAIGDRLNLFSLGEAAAPDDVDPALSGARSGVIQRGGLNLADVIGLGSVQSMIAQFGQGNQADVRQDGTGLVSVVEQGRVPGEPSAFETELNGLSEVSDPFGGVSGNRAFIDQSGLNNRSILGQFGQGGDAEIIQRGTSNFSSVFQSGDDASVFVSQTGERNRSVIIQNDFAVRANMVQVGEDGLSEIRQWDRSSGSIAQVFQAGSRGMSDIDQAGVRNLATVVQWDQGERSASTIIQDGDLGEAKIDQAGRELVSIVRQGAGTMNGATVFQAGSDQVSEIVQAGMSNIATVRQGGAGSRSIISQIGTGHVATVVQSSSSILP